MQIIKQDFDKKTFKSPLTTVTGNEGDKCNYPTRLDPYGKGCYYNCKYCYAKSLLDFRGYWNPSNPSVTPLKQIINTVKKLKTGTVVRLGGMTDCFQPKEAITHRTAHTIQLLNKKKIHYLIVTKSDLLLRKQYMKLLDKQLAHIQISIPTTNDNTLNNTDNAPPFKQRKKTVETLYKKGYDISIRCSPILYDTINYDLLNNIECNKILIEFLRINSKIKQQLKNIINTHEYTHKENNYYHLPLKQKIKILNKITNFDQKTVCEDCTTHYNFFKDHYNYNPDDCCNLTFS